MYQLTRAAFPSLEPGNEGRVVPWIIGRMLDVPGIGLSVGLVSAVAVAMTASDPATGTSLSVRGDASLGRWPSSGTLQIDSERITYTGLNLVSQAFTGITRGAGGTTAAIHAVGTAVYQVLTEAIHIFAENPGAHLTRAVVQVKLDGAPKAAATAPVHTVTLADGTIVTGRSFVVVRFDLSTVTAPVSRTPTAPRPPMTLSIVATGGATPVNSSAPPPAPVNAATVIPPASPSPTPSIAQLLGHTPGLGPGGFSQAGASVGAAAASGYWVPGIAGNFWVSTPTPTAPPREPTITVVELPPTFLGSVTADIDGLQDDASGTITDAPLSLIERPSHVVELLLREAWAETASDEYNVASFAEALTYQAALDLTWALVFDGPSFESFRALALFHGRADLFQESGLWVYRYRRRTNAVLTFGDTVQIGEPLLGLTPRQNWTTQLTVTYGIGRAQKTLVLDDTTAQARIGVQRPHALQLPWVTREENAVALGNYWLSQWSQGRMTVVSHVPWVALTLELGDCFDVSSDVLSPYGTLLFHLRTRSFDLDAQLMQLTGEQAEDAEAAARGLGLTRLTGAGVPGRPVGSFTGR